METMDNLSRISDSFSMLGIGMGVVFLVLLLLWFCFELLKNILIYFDKQAELKKNKATSTPATSNKVELTADVNAAISMALYLHFNEHHDHESEILTIQTMQRRYSPWSSKIYGLNTLKR